jgi:hypothetical protein
LPPLPPLRDQIEEVIEAEGDEGFGPVISDDGDGDAPLGRGVHGLAKRCSDVWLLASLGFDPEHGAINVGDLFATALQAAPYVGAGHGSSKEMNQLSLVAGTLAS